jgi:hypothetical protein
MHVDRSDTHIISSILHIDHKYDNDDEGWPIEIEDYNGKTHAVDLKPGQMLHYESAKCFHGRPKVLKGKYYASIFIHYRPAEVRLFVGRSLPSFMSACVLTHAVRCFMLPLC